MSDVGGPSEEISHSPARQKNQYCYDDWYTDRRSRLCPQEYVNDIAQQIDCEENDRQPEPPTVTAPETNSCRGASYRDSAH